MSTETSHCSHCGTAVTYWQTQDGYTGCCNEPVCDGVGEHETWNVGVWDYAADAYTQRQASGDDFYRYEFLGPAQVEACGDVAGLAVLDVGCGNGYLARELARRGARMTGIDISPRMIEHARAQEAADPLGIDYRVADAAEIADHFAAGSFDMAASCIALQDMPALSAVLRAVHAVLRPGGRFVASITHPCTDTPFRQWERDESRAKRWLCIDRYFERGEWA
jgi:2-polyprenyl-3-methyl-5-hydroxy-6-metoxy-1,4-benzoquinol methylase